MSGINAFFHLGSALAAGFLVYWILSVKRQRDFLRTLMAELRGSERRIHVSTPEDFLADFAQALGFDCECVGRPSKPVKIVARPLVDLFVSRGIVLIRCKDSEIEVQVPTGAGFDRAAAAKTLSVGLGDQVRVTVTAAPQGEGVSP